MVFEFEPRGKFQRCWPPGQPAVAGSNRPWGSRLHLPNKTRRASQAFLTPDRKEGKVVFSSSQMACPGRFHGEGGGGTVAANRGGFGLHRSRRSHGRGTFATVIRRGQPRTTPADRGAAFCSSCAAFAGFVAVTNPGETGAGQTRGARA